MPGDDGDDETIYKVVRNHEEQYSASRRNRARHRDRR
jgi:uncharacterized protein YbdZ (MbtH family)